MASVLRFIVDLAESQRVRLVLQARQCSGGGLRTAACREDWPHLRSSLCLDLAPLTPPLQQTSGTHHGRRTLRYQYYQGPAGPAGTCGGGKFLTRVHLSPSHPFALPLLVAYCE